MAELTNRLVAFVRRADPEPDTELLSRFLESRDGEAFAALVRRHGPMVLAVCRRILRHHADAEDAFQATFLILARRAGSVRKRSMLANWLYGVAYRTAMEARRAMAVRRAKETRAAAMKTDTVEENGDSQDLRDVLDRELAGLPEVYRVAVVLCELEGVSRKDAAVRLGWSEGTLSSRLSRARSLLARRLARYGLAVPAGGLAVMAQQASAESVAGLTNSLVRIGTLVAAGEAAIAAPVAALMEGTMKAMLLAKLKTTATALVVGCAVLVTATAGWQANAAGGADPQDREKPTTPRKTARDEDKERIKELERERDKLLKELTELRDRVTKLEYARLAAEAKAALEKAELGAAMERARELAELRSLEAAKGKTTKTPAKPSTTAPAAGDLSPLIPPSGISASSPSARPATTEPLRPPAVAVAPANSFPRSAPQPGTTVETTPPLPVGRPATAEPIRPSGTTTPTLEPLPTAAAKAPTSVQVYRVGDLVTDDKDGEALVKVVKAVVEAQSWGAGAGVEYLPGRRVLVVRQTEKGQEEVAKLLEMLKKNGEPAPRK